MSNESTTTRQDNNTPRTERPESHHTETPPENEKAAKLPLDLVFDALKNSRRRHVLLYLKEQGKRVTLSDLAEHVVAIENGTTATTLNSYQRKRVYVCLYQCDLPRLDDIGVAGLAVFHAHERRG